MIKANFSAYSKYVTDSLYQWDRNRTLTVTGLNLTAKPEVHFSNANLGGAIVAQADMVNHIVSVPIPNSLLQDPLRIYAHIGIYEGDEFKVVELVEIPVIPRQRPADYQLAEDDFELYSFKRLENMIQNINDTWVNKNAEQVQAYVTAWLDDHPEATTTVQDGSIGKAKLTEDLLTEVDGVHHYTDNVINVKKYGAAGDGATDDWAAIKAACESVTDNSILYFPPGVYVIDFPEANVGCIDLRYLKNIEICGSNATIKVKPNKWTGYNVIWLVNSDNVKIHGLTIAGDRLLHDYTTHSGTHEFGYGVYLSANVEPYTEMNISIYDCEIYDMTGDAICTKNGMGGGKVQIDRCRLHHCRRQGISILDSDSVEVSNTHIHHIGTHDGISGAAPMSGIDIEPASGTKEVNSVLIRDCTIVDCTNYSVVSAEACIDLVHEINIYNTQMMKVVIAPAVTCHNCQFGRYVNGAIEYSTYLYFNPEKGVLRNCSLLGSAEELYAKEVNNSALVGDGTFVVRHTELNNCSVSGCILRNSAAPNNWGGANNCAFKGCDFGFYNSTDAGPFNNCSIAGCTGTNVVGSPVFNNCYLDKKYFAAGVYNGGCIAG